MATETGGTITLHKHDCGCVTTWDEKKDHPMYLSVCGLHRKAVPPGWFRAKPGPRVRKPVSA